MDTAAVADFAYLALFLAERGDGELEDDELRVLLHAVRRVGEENGLSPPAAKHAAMAASQSFQDDLNGSGREGVAERVLARVDRLGQHGQHLLPGLYRDLVQIAASDGQTEQGEAKILGIVRSRWRL